MLKSRLFSETDYDVDDAIENHSDDDSFYLLEQEEVYQDTQHAYLKTLKESIIAQSLKSFFATLNTIDLEFINENISYLKRKLLKHGNKKFFNFFQEHDKLFFSQAEIDAAMEKCFEGHYPDLFDAILDASSISDKYLIEKIQSNNFDKEIIIKVFEYCFSYFKDFEEFFYQEIEKLANWFIQYKTNFSRKLQRYLKEKLKTYNENDFPYTMEIKLLQLFGKGLSLNYSKKKSKTEQYSSDSDSEEIDVSNENIEQGKIWSEMANFEDFKVNLKKSLTLLNRKPLLIF